MVGFSHAQMSYNPCRLTGKWNYGPSGLAWSYWALSVYWGEWERQPNMGGFQLINTRCNTGSHPASRPWALCRAAERSVYTGRASRATTEYRNEFSPSTRYLQY